MSTTPRGNRNRAGTPTTTLPSDPTVPAGRALVLLLMLTSLGITLGYLVERTWQQHRRELAARQNLATQLVAAIVSHADDERHDPRLAAPLLKSAIEHAQASQVSGEPAAHRLAELPTPVLLPADTHVEIMAARPSPAAGVIDLRIVGAGGKPIANLSRIDIELECGGQRQRHLTIAPLAAGQQSLHVAILLDASTSIEGPPFHSSLAQTRQLIASLAPAARIRIWKFASDVQPLSGWTSDAATLTQAVTGLQASGATMLHGALRMAAEDLVKHPGFKAIVLFTDGRDSFRQESGESILVFCRRHGIKVHVAALQSGDVDKVFLSRLAAETNGTFHLSAQHGDLANVTQTILSVLKSPTHRVVTLGSFQTAEPCRLQIGSLRPQEFVWQ